MTSYNVTVTLMLKTEKAITLQPHRITVKCHDIEAAIPLALSELIEVVNRKDIDSVHVELNKE